MKVYFWQHAGRGRGGLVTGQRGGQGGVLGKDMGGQYQQLPSPNVKVGAISVHLKVFVYNNLIEAFSSFSSVLLGQ